MVRSSSIDAALQLMAEADFSGSICMAERWRA